MDSRLKANGTPYQGPSERKPVSVRFKGMTMARERLSRLQRRILAWLAAEEQRTRGTIAASHQDLVRALAHDKGNLSTSLQSLAAKGLVTIARTPGGKAEAVDLTAEGRQRVAPLTGSCE
jgi:DNA-binding MarR family transcriptional regulator